MYSKDLTWVTRKKYGKNALNTGYRCSMHHQPPHTAWASIAAMMAHVLTTVTLFVSWQHHATQMSCWKHGLVGAQFHHQ